jgi:hypothetical protein
MMPPVQHKQKGSIVLVALCFVAVMAISVTTYLTLSSRAMNLSARSFNSGLSAQVAEAGMELAMSALNNSNWTGWTTSGATATRTHTPATNYGLGITASVKILVTNRNVSTWRSATSYTAGNLAWYNGQWYLCTSATGPTLVRPPDDNAAWTSAPGDWSATTLYAAGDIVTWNGTVYRCLLSHASKVPPETNYWSVSSTAAWSASTSYSANDTALYGGTVYKCVTAHSAQTPTNTTYWAGPPVIYAEGNISVPSNNPTQKIQLRAEFIPAPLFPNAAGATNSTTSISIASSGLIESYNSNLLQPVQWSASSSYVAGAVVFYPASGLYYRALVAHSNQAPVVSGGTNYNYWTPAVPSYRAWNSSVSYAIGDLVTYSGKLYRGTAANSNQVPPNSSYWVEQMEYVAWSSTKDYPVDALVMNAAGTVYRSKITPNLNQVLTNTTYWEVHNLGTNPTTWVNGTSYLVNDLVSDTGIYYRCIQAHTASASRTTSDAGYWARELVGYPVWKSGVTYSVGNVVFYQPPAINSLQGSGMLYRCRSAHTSSPTDTPAFTLTSPSNKWEVGTVNFATWTSTTGYRVGDVVFYPPTGLQYRCKTAHTNQAPIVSSATNTTYWENTGRAYTAWSSSTTYSVGAVVFNATNATVYRCIQAHTNQAPPNASYWTQLGADFAHWSGTAAYSVGDIVYKTSNQTVYRCISAHTNQAPPNATFWSTALQGYSAVVAAPAVRSTSTAVIRGYVNATTTTFGSNAIVQGPASPASPKVDPLRVFSNPFVPQFSPPASYAALSSSGSDLPESEGNGTRLYEGARTLGTPGATSPSVYNITATYYGGGSSTTSGLYLDTSTDASSRDSNDVLNIVGPVILNVSGILYTSPGRIIIAPTGSLEIYFYTSQLYLGDSTTTTGGGIVNQTFRPAKMLLGSASTYNSSSYHYLWQWQPFHGLIYMPNAYLHKWNSSYSGELYGALSAKTVYFNHAATLDYDTALRTAGSIGTYIEQPYQITSWRELTDPAERISL